MFRTMYMTKEARKKKEWIHGPTFETLELAKLYCAIIRLIWVGVWHTRVEDEFGNSPYFVDNKWAAIYDLAGWAMLPPHKIADETIQTFKKEYQR